MYLRMCFLLSVQTIMSKYVSIIFYTSCMRTYIPDLESRQFLSFIIKLHSSISFFCIYHLLVFSHHNSFFFFFFLYLSSLFNFSYLSIFFSLIISSFFFSSTPLSLTVFQSSYFFSVIFHFFLFFFLHTISCPPSPPHNYFILSSSIDLHVGSSATNAFILYANSCRLKPPCFKVLICFGAPRFVFSVNF